MKSVFYKGERIYFILERKNVKNINLTIKPNLEIYVSANESVAIEYIEEFIISKGGFITEHLNKLKKLRKDRPKEREYVNGEKFMYLGREYLLKLYKSKYEYVNRSKDRIEIYTKDTDDREKKEKLLNDWYRSRAILEFEDSLDRMYGLVDNFKKELPDLKIRRMKRRLGTCYIYQNKIILNTNLILTPRKCIDYVVLHELIHFKHKNHDRDFYDLLETLMDDWRDRKRVVEEIIVREL